jgi:hypothetical protein
VGSGAYFRHRWVAACAILGAVAVFCFRFVIFGDVDPRSDQAFFAWWAQGLGLADHFLPIVNPGQGWFSALQNDTESYLNQLFRPIYNKPTSIFTLLPLGVIRIVSWVAGDGYSVQTAVSIAFSAFAVLVVSLVPLWLWAGESVPSRERLALSLVALAFGALSLYPHLFSPWGIHNAGAAFLVLAVACGTPVHRKLVTGSVADVPVPWIAAFAVSQVLALYAHWTNTFLLPVATVLALFVGGNAGFKRRITMAAVYVCGLFVVWVPLYPLIAFEFFRPAYSKEHSLGVLAQLGYGGELPAVLMQAFERAVNWFAAVADLFSAPGLMLGLAGLIALAWGKGKVFPAMAVVSHILMWAAIPQFSVVHVRTGLYVMPFLAIGGGYFCWVICKELTRTPSSRPMRGIPIYGAVALGIGLSILHFARQAPVLLDHREARDILPQVWHDYFAGQGELRIVIDQLQNGLPADATLMTWGYGPQFLYRNLTEPSARRAVLPALSALWLRVKTGELKAHLRQRRLVLGRGPVYLVFAPQTDHIGEADMRKRVFRVLGKGGFAAGESWRMTEVKTWRVDSAWPGDLTLYRLYASPVDG